MEMAQSWIHVESTATDWAGEEEWMRERNVKWSLADMYKFVTFALDSVKLSVQEREKQRDRRRCKRRYQGTWNPRIPPSTREKIGLL